MTGLQSPEHAANPGKFQLQPAEHEAGLSESKACNAGEAYLAGEGAWDRRPSGQTGSPRSTAASQSDKKGPPILRRTSMSHPSFKRKQIVTGDGRPDGNNQPP